MRNDKKNKSETNKSIINKTTVVSSRMHDRRILWSMET
jgi:hypothetical protein